jgi:hypothetical protein
MDKQESVPFAFGLNYDSAMFQRNGSAYDLKRTSDSVRSLDPIFGIFIGQTTGTISNFLHTGITMQQSGTLAQHFDVAILGSGIAGGLMGCILARQGLKVVIIDAGTHPRFALGESTIGETTYLLRVLAERYDVPEIAHCSSLSDVWQHVTSACAIKRNSGFVYHKDKIQHPTEMRQCNVSEFPVGAQMHYYLQDMDAYLFHSAIKYGAIAKQHTQVETVQLHSQGVTIATDTGEKFEVAYVVDGSGYDSVLARQFKLREHPSRFKTHSRSLFTHASGVKPVDECTQPIGQPSNADRFADAHSVRDWVSTTRTQFASTQTVGDRWCLMSHAAGAVDTLSSRGMSSTTQVVNSAAALILQAFKDGDFSAQRFEYLDLLNQTHLLNINID